MGFYRFAKSKSKLFVTGIEILIPTCRDNGFYAQSAFIDSCRDSYDNTGRCPLFRCSGVITPANKTLYNCPGLQAGVSG